MTVRFFCYFFSIVCFSLCYTHLASGEPGSCKNQRAYRDIVNIILLDQTTTLNEESKDQFSSGIFTILKNTKIHGKLVVYEIRESDFQGTHGQKTCLDAFPYAQNQLENNLSNDSFLDYLKNSIFGFGDEAYAKSHANDVIEEEFFEKRKYIASKIIKLTSNQNNGTKETSIINQIARTFQVNCPESSECNFFIFSDMLDSRVKRYILKHDNIQLVELAENDAGAALQDFNVKNTTKKITVIIWGLGRNDISPDSKLTSNEYRRLRIYWTAFLAKLLGGAENLHQELSTEFPEALFAQIFK